MSDAKTPPGANPPSSIVRDRVTIRTLRQMAAAGRPFSSLTAYDATTARIFDRAGIDVLLVGDTAAEVILGFGRTIDMPLDLLIALTGAVRRGASRAMVMGDMPFLSYHGGEAQALANAGRFMVEGQADVVKIEADASFGPIVRAMTRAGIPVCAHVGSRPQRAALAGGYGPSGRRSDEADQIVRDAAALEAAGSVLLLVEAVPDEVTERILKETSAPVIGIGAGAACHGQVLVWQDALGVSDVTPRFADPVAQIGPAMEAAAREWARRVASRQIGGRRYTMVSQSGRNLEAPTDESKPGAPNRTGKGAEPRGSSAGRA